MKKTIAILLAFCLCIALCACGNGTKANTENSSGYATKEEAVDAFLTMRFIKVGGKEECRKNVPEQLLRYIGGESGLSERYERYKVGMEQEINRAKENYGDDYRVNWEIIEVKDLTSYGYKFSEQERQECRNMLGVEPEDISSYTVGIYMTITGSKDSMTKRSDVDVFKLADRWYCSDFLAVFI